MTENNYYRWMPVRPNKWGLTHYLKDRKTSEEWLVHATTRRFPIIDSVCILRVTTT